MLPLVIYSEYVFLCIMENLNDAFKVMSWYGARINKTTRELICIDKQTNSEVVCGIRIA